MRLPFDLIMSFGEQMSLKQIPDDSSAEKPPFSLWERWICDESRVLLVYYLYLKSL